MIDRYTKAVLTVIAVSLIVLVAQNTVRLAWADVDYNDACGTATHPACQVMVNGNAGAHFALIERAGAHISASGCLLTDLS